MSEKKPTPQTQLSGKVCPVCGHQTYSQGGIHPQCAVLQADAARAEKLKAERKREANEANETKRSTWRNKSCTKCGMELHVRRKVCDCGQVFF